MFASAGGVTTKTLESEVEAHPRYSGQQDGGGEKKYEERTASILTGTTMRSLVNWTNPIDLLIFGPAKQSLN